MGLRDELTRRGRTLLACLALVGCQGGPATQTCQMVHVTDLKVLRQGRAFFTEIAINGQPAVVQVDTGSSDNLITEDAAHRLGMKVSVSGDVYVEGVGGRQMAGTAQSREVSLGDAHGKQLAFSTIPDRVHHLGADGLLGMNFLYGFDLDLDFWGGHVGLYKTIGGCDSPRAALAQPLYSVDLLPGTGTSPEVMVSINGQSLQAMIDTGADRTTIFRQAARRAGLITGDLADGLKFGGVGLRAVKGERRISAPVVIGDLTISKLPVNVVDQRTLGDVDMLLGFDFVTHVHVWISHSSRTVIMQYPPLPTQSADHAM